MKIKIYSYGCTQNHADAQILRGYLEGHEFTALEKAETVIINTCAVKNATESRMMSQIAKCLRDPV